jgi:gluconolactonase
VLKLLSVAALFFVTAIGGGKLPPEAAVAPVKLVELPGYTEGVVFDRDGVAYVSDTQHGTIYRVTPSGEASLWATTGAPNGHKILADGTHLVCDGKQHAVLRLSPDGKLLDKAASECDGRALREPNDLSLDPKGGFYFTDPGGSSAESPTGTVHYVDRRGKTHLVASGLAFPNGIILWPGGKLLIVGESEHNRILAYPVLAPGKVGAQRVFATLPDKRGDQIANAPDGMCLDDAGHLFVAHYGMHTVQVLDGSGRLLRSYPAGTLTTSNVAFGGPNRDQLYITGALGDEKTTPGAIFRLDLEGVRGLALPPQARRR